MKRIQVMSEMLANQIAAGEVVERPSSVVKELVENAIDAGASTILVEIIEAGIQSIKVTDDGHGIHPDDLLLAFAPHATSKIIKAEDIFNIHSLGFRGEALASIASVSKVYIETKTADKETGHYLKIEGSQVIDQGTSKAKNGTSVRVESLFYNTPARLKHLKSLNTELKHVLNFIQNLALAYPNIRFVLESDGREIFKSFGNGSLQQAIASIYQPKIARDLVFFQAENLDFNIQGYVSMPTLTRTNMQYIHWFINQRPVKSRLLSEVLVRAYGKQLMVGRYPIAVIHIHLDARLVDVNVHPTKQIVRLSKEEELAELLRTTIQSTITSHRDLPLVELDSQPDRLSSLRTDDETIIQASLIDTGATTFKQFRQDNSEITPELSETDDAGGQHTQIYPEYPKVTSEIKPQQMRFLDHDQVDDASRTYHIEPFKKVEPSPQSINFDQLRYIGQFHGTYLIAEDETGLYFIDQHAAQEVIRYEFFMSEDYDIHQQQFLLIPELIEMTLSQTQEVLDNMEDFQRLGIHLNQLSPTSFQFESYPSWMDSEDLVKHMQDVIDKVCQQPKITIHDLIASALIMRSCRGAIKANHRLDDQQARYLIQSLQDLQDPYHCPHGRPVIIKLTPETMEKLFKRIQDSHTSQYDAQF